MGEQELPKGWVWTTIDHLCTTSSGGTPLRSKKEYYGGHIPWVKSGELKDTLIDKSEEMITKMGLENSSAKLFPKGTVLVAMYGANVGKTGILGIDATTNQAVCAIFNKEYALDRAYLFSYLLSQKENLIKKSFGGAQPNISQEVVNKLEIPLPPLNEQKRIVSKIEELFKESKTARKTLGETPLILKRFRQSVLKSAYQGKLTEDWREENLGEESAIDLLKRIGEERIRNYDEECTRAKRESLKKPKKDYEISILGQNEEIPTWVDVKLENLVYIAARIGWRGLKAEEYTETGPLFLSVYNLNNGEYVDFTNVYHISMERYEESPEIQLRENDILLAKDGAGIGKIGIVKNLKEAATVNSSLLVIRSGEAFIPKYLFYFLSGPEMQSIVKTKITGSATPHLFQRDIKEFTLSMPPLEEQREIVKRIESYFELSNQIEKSVKEVKKRADKIDQAILAKAFHGELVPQDPNDDPAGGLLEKTKSEREKTLAVKTARKIKHKQ